MYSKGLGRFVKNILRIILALIKMCTTERNTEETYAFKAFQYEKVVPSPKTRVPFPRSGHRISADSSNFYSFGGYNPLIINEDIQIEGDVFYVNSYPLFQELWKFNFASKRWIKYSNSETLPKELASNALILHKNVLMVYGGTGSPFGFRCSNQLHVCKISDESSPMMEVNTTGHLPPPLYGQALIYHNDYLYTIGGTSGLSYTCDIHRLNIKTLTWEMVYVCSGVEEYEPEGRYRHEVGFDGQNIYVLGGGTAEDAFDFLDVPKFDIEKKKWYKQRTIQDGTRGVPSARKCHGAVQIESELGVKVFITGGHDGENIFNDLWRLDLKTSQWTFFETCSLPRPSYFHAASVTPEGRLYVFGGIYCLNEENRRSNDIYSTWLCIPKLSEISWEAVLHYSPHIVKCKSDDLINIGLPKKFVQRLGIR